MEVRRSARIANKQAKKGDPWVLPDKVRLQRRNGVIVRCDDEKEESVVSQKHQQTSLFINFIVHGVMKYEINDPKARDMKQKAILFLQLTVAFLLIKCFFWCFGVL